MTAFAYTPIVPLRTKKGIVKTPHSQEYYFSHSVALSVKLN